MSSSTSTSTTLSKGYPPKTGPFIIKLRQAVTACPPSIGRWSENGSRFDVLRPEEFDQYLRSKYFVGTEATFLRQLHFYQFRKIDCAHGGGDGETPGTWSFVHAHFLRDDPNDDVSIKRVVGSTSRSRGTSSSSATATSLNGTGMVDLATYTKSQRKVAELEAELARMHEHMIDLERKLEASEQARKVLLSRRSTSSRPEEVERSLLLPEARTPVSRSDSSLSLFNVLHNHSSDFEEGMYDNKEDDEDDDVRRSSPASHLSNHEHALPNDDMVQDLMLPDDEMEGMYNHNSSDQQLDEISRTTTTRPDNEMELIHNNNGPALLPPTLVRSFSEFGESYETTVNPAVVARVVNFLRKSLHTTAPPSYVPQQEIVQQQEQEQQQAQADVGRMLPTLLATPTFQKALLEAVASSAFRSSSAETTTRGGYYHADYALRPNMDIF